MEQTQSTSEWSEVDWKLEEVSSAPESSNAWNKIPSCKRRDLWEDCSRKSTPNCYSTQWWPQRYLLYATTHLPPHPHCSQPPAGLSWSLPHFWHSSFTAPPSSPTRASSTALLSRAMTTSSSVLETLFQDFGGPMWQIATWIWPRLHRIGGSSLVLGNLEIRVQFLITQVYTYLSLSTKRDKNARNNETFKPRYKKRGNSLALPKMSQTRNTRCCAKSTLNQMLLKDPYLD